MKHSISVLSVCLAATMTGCGPQVHQDNIVSHRLHDVTSVGGQHYVSDWECASKMPPSSTSDAIRGRLQGGTYWVFAADAAHGCVVFYRGKQGGWQSTAIATHAFSSPWSGATVEQAQFVDPLHGFVLVGGSPVAQQQPRVLFSTLDGGIAWRNLPANSEQPFPSSDTEVTMRFTSPSDGWLVTVNDFYRPDRLYVYHTTDGGETWSATYASFPPFYGTLPYQKTNPPIFTNANDGMIEVLSQPDGTGGYYPSLLFTTVDGGTNWTFVPLSNG